jgi:hypothetical protein
MLSTHILTTVLLLITTLVSFSVEDAEVVVDHKEMSAPNYRAEDIVPVIDVPDVIKQGWDAGHRLLDTIKNSDTVKDLQAASKWFLPLANSINYFAKLILSFNSADSKELKYMKEQFQIIHNKMDTMELEFHEIKRMIDWNSIKISFGEHERTINSLQEYVTRMTTAPPEIVNIFKEQFVLNYERAYRDAATMIYQGIANERSIYTDNLIVAVRKFTGDHQRKVLKFLLGLLQLIIQGLKLEVFYMNCKGYENAVTYWSKDWETRITQMSETFQRISNEIENNYLDQVKNDLEDFNAKKHTLDNRQYSLELFNYLADKFPYREWMVMVYNPLLGFKEHCITYCGGVTQFRVRNHNIVVSSVRASQSQIFNVAQAQTAINNVPNNMRSLGGKTLPVFLVDEIIKQAPIDCSRYSMAAAIKWGGGLWYMSNSQRRVYREWTHAFNSRLKMNLLLFG